MKVITAAVVGALCGGGWLYSSLAAFDLPCNDGTGASCSFFVVLCVIPALLCLWVLAAWGLLRLARYSPTWPTVLAGTSIAIALAFVLGLVVRPVLPSWSALVVVPFAGAVGYALAAKATASYRGQVQDGTPSA